MKPIFTVLLLFLASNAQAISASGLLKKMQAAYEESDYTCQISYRSFSGHSSDELIESFDGFSTKQGGNWYQKLGNTEWISTSSMAIHVMKSEKRLLVSEASKSNGQKMEPASFLFNASDTKVEEFESSYKVEINYEQNGLSPYKKVIFQVEKSTLMMTELQLYSSQKKVIASKNGLSQEVLPRVEITFSEYDFKAEIDTSLFHLQTYINEATDRLLPTELYKGYTVYDLRTKKN